MTDQKEVVKIITTFIKEQAPNGVVIGLSGGLDSSVAAALAVKALGREKVLGIMMPGENTPDQDSEDALALIEMFKINYKHFSIDRLLSDNIYSYLPDDNLSKGNLTARFRMAILYAHAGSMGRKVLGTSDKTEIKIGYFTKYGDGGADLLPLGDLYKTQVRELARFLGLPKRIIDKPSSPGLWKNHTAEGEIGFSYEDIDSMLKGDMPISEELQHRIDSTAHKRVMPPVCQLITAKPITVKVHV